MCSSGYIAVVMQDENAWDKNETTKELSNFITHMGWYEQLNMTTTRVRNNMKKGIDYKSNKTMHQERLTSMVNKAWEGKTWQQYTDPALLKQIQEEFSYNLPDQEWVLIAYPGELKKLGNNTVLSVEKKGEYHYLKNYYDDANIREETETYSRTNATVLMVETSRH